MTTLATLQSQLTSVQSAIEKIESCGQAYGINGRRLDRGDLKTLYDREKYLENRIARASRTHTGIKVRYVEPT